MATGKHRRHSLRSSKLHVICVSLSALSFDTYVWHSVRCQRSECVVFFSVKCLNFWRCSVTYRSADDDYGKEGLEEAFLAYETACQSESWTVC